MSDCLDNIVGLTLNTCDCWDGDKPSNFDEINASSTGVYLTEGKDGFSLLPAIYHALDCGRGDNIFSVLQSAREEAIRSFRRDLGAELLDTALLRKTSEEIIGMTEYRSGNVTYTDVVNGLAIQSSGPIKGGHLEIKSLSVGFHSVDPVDITIDGDGVTAQTFTVQPVANEWVSVPVNMVLPLWIDGRTDAPRYTISYDAENHRPMDNRLRCCSGGGKFGLVSAAGFSGTIPDRSVDVPFKTNAYGLSLSTVSACDKTEWICRYASIGDYEMASVLAHTIQFKAFEILAQYVLDSSHISKFTTLSRESLYGKRNHASKRYSENITWVSQHIPMGASDCIKCTSKIRLRKTTI